MILAGDVGGTHTRMGLFSFEEGHVKLHTVAEFSSRQYPGLEQIILSYAESQAAKVEVCCFGVAGPVVQGHVQLTNLPWEIDEQKGSEVLGYPLMLINDLEATAYGISELGPEDFVTLQESRVPQAGNAAVIAAGTGLGEAGLFWDGVRHIPFACEGGHCDFAPNGELQARMLGYLRGQGEHVSMERVISGPGLVSIHAFLRATAGHAEDPWLEEELRRDDPAAAISRAALAGTSELCMRALDIFVSCYGAEAGNLALKLMAVGGVYVAGGIAPKILPKLRDETFRNAFVNKGRLSDVLEAIPVRVVTNERTGLLGAARCAALARAVGRH
jgi:glucokinase